MVLWDAATGRRLTEAELVVNEGEVNNVAFSPDGKTICWPDTAVQSRLF